MNVETANRLQMLRKKNNLSQEELAERIGISRQAVSKWERAEASPDTDNLILLAKLYGVTLDELLRTESVHFPNEDGISLRKEDYVAGTSVPIDDDGEIYPNGRNSASASQNTSGFESAYDGKWESYTDNSANSQQNNGNFSANNANNNANVGEFVKNVAEFTVNVTKEALGAAAKGLEEANKSMKNNQNTSSESGFDKLDKDFEKFDKQFEESFKGFDEKMNKMGKDFEDKMNNAFKTNSGDEPEAKKVKVKKEKKKYPATLLDKLFPLITVCAFFLIGAIDDFNWCWIVFLFIPVYYIFSHFIKKYGAEDCTIAEMAFGILDGCVPLAAVIWFFFTGAAFDAYGWCWMIFLFIPVYYIFSAAVKKYAAGVLNSTGMLIFFLNGSVPIITVIVFMFFGMLFDWWMWGIFFIIPFYYIIADHLRKNKK